MFQNISKESEQEFNEEIKVNKKEEVKEIFKKLFTKQNTISIVHRISAESKGFIRKSGCW